MSEGTTEQQNPKRYRLGPTFRCYLGNKISLDLSDEALNVLNNVMNKTNDEVSDIFRKALSLYAVALDAHQQSKAVGVASSPEVLETEFVGF